MAGGALGAASAEWLLLHLGTVGSYVAVISTIAAGLTVMLGIDWETLAGRGVSAVESKGPAVRGGLARAAGAAASTTDSGWKATARMKAMRRTLGGLMAFIVVSVAGRPVRS